MNPPTALIAAQASCLRFRIGYASVNVAKHWEPAEFNAFMNQVKAAAIHRAQGAGQQGRSGEPYIVASDLRLEVRSVTMPKKSKPIRPKPPAGSLLSPEAMGGITASKGFGFQTRYAVCQLPVWLLDPAFHQLFHEGTGDIDIRFQEGARSSRIHVQVKDHNVAPAEFCEVVAQFRKRDAEFVGIYTCFTLVCPSLSENLHSIESGLARLRNAKPFYDDVAAAMAPTKVELDARMRSAGLTQDQLDFVHSKVNFDIVQETCTTTTARRTFIAQLLKHPEYKQMIRDAVQPPSRNSFGPSTQSAGLSSAALTSKTSCGNRSSRSGRPKEPSLFGCKTGRVRRSTSRLTTCSTGRRSSTETHVASLPKTSGTGGCCRN